jgi:hypothetical protein
MNPRTFTLPIAGQTHLVQVNLESAKAIEAHGSQPFPVVVQQVASSSITAMDAALRGIIAANKLAVTDEDADAAIMKDTSSVDRPLYQALLQYLLAFFPQSDGGDADEKKPQTQSNG